MLHTAQAGIIFHLNIRAKVKFYAGDQTLTPKFYKEVNY
jgi:hypothetical protein